MIVGAGERFMRCDRCRRRSEDDGTINPVMALLAEGAWAVRWGPPEEHLCPDCFREEDRDRGYERAA